MNIQEAIDKGYAINCETEDEIQYIVDLACNMGYHVLDKLSITRVSMDVGSRPIWCGANEKTLYVMCKCPMGVSAINFKDLSLGDKQDNEPTEGGVFDNTFIDPCFKPEAFLFSEENTFTKDTPEYYKSGNVQPFDIMKEQGLFKPFCEACLIKYSMRLTTKGQYLSDLKKIKHYAEVLIEMEGGE